MKKLTLTSVVLLLNSVQITTREQGAVIPATTATKGATATVQHYLIINGTLIDLGNLGFYKEFPITELEATTQSSLALAEKLIKAEYPKVFVA